MRKIRYFLIIFTALLMLTASIASMSAQDIDVGSMDNAQLTELLLQIMQKLQQEDLPADETEEEVSPTAAAAAVPAADPEPIPEPEGITVYENKKLMIEKLPEYMFIQPTEPPKPEKMKPDSPKDPSTPTGGDRDSYCTGKCMGYSDFYGIDMLDMGCYAKCMGDI